MNPWNRGAIHANTRRHEGRTVRAIVCGGRDLADRAYVFRTLDALRETMGLSHVIQGGATGADLLAFAWTKNRKGVECETYEADWQKHGKAAGPMRNAR